MRLADLLQRDGAVRFDCFVVNANKRGNAIDCGKNLVFEVGLVMEGGAHKCLAFHQIHGVDQVFIVEGDGKRMAYRSNLQAGDVEDAEF